MPESEYEETVFLPTIPGLGALYTQGVAGSVRGKLGLTPPGAAVELPRVVYQASGVQTDDLAEQLREYQELVHEPLSDLMPSGYLHVLAFPLAMAVMVRPDFPLPLLGMVHLANDASLYRPVELGDVLEVKAWAENLRPHPKGTQVDLVGEVWVDQPDGADPVLAWHGVSTYLAKGVSLPTSEEVSTVGAHAPGSTTDVVGANAPGSTTDVDAGAPSVVLREVAESRFDGTSNPTNDWTPPFPTGRWNLSSGLGREYAAISGDRNPIHLSALTAKAFGFPRAIAHGMYTAARALAETGPGRGDTYRWTVDFAKPVLLPSKVDVAITPMHDDAVVPRATSNSAGYAYQGWNSKKQIKHFSGTVTPI